MHELSIALSLLDGVTEEAVRQNAARVVAIHLRLGALSGVVKEALASAFNLARTGTSLENASLIIEEIPAATYCPTCAAEQVVASIQQLCCPVCGTPTPQVVRGRELEIVALEIET